MTLQILAAVLNLLLQGSDVPNIMHVQPSEAKFLSHTNLVAVWISTHQCLNALLLKLAP
ncbi:MAG: hypothetical protein WC203_08630 [Candidatus Bathyarchaeia archaeon]|nr:hypothetical protein [Candidatus Bathyarchaeota archaeon]NLD65539.1 hypothetical protein [Thermoproteota archaeon]